ncbi:GDNF family receptor alpha-like isoform X2 [Lepisosteus oculatus]|nr:PREDICTED: GDNF family receptor alpha-like isoform X2 [Lepisosteus oculatus]
MICTIPSKTADCIMAKEKCASDSSACRSAWDLLINVCNATGESCRINLSHRCNMTVQYMMNSYPELKGCLSMEDVSCSILRLIAPQCTDRSDGLGQKQRTQCEGTGKWRGTRGHAIAPLSCVSALEHCQESQHCSSLYENMKDLCRTDKGQCNTVSFWHFCLSAWKELVSATPLANCTCSSQRRRNCVKIWNTLYNNSCIKHDEKYQDHSNARHENTSEGQVVNMFKPEKDPKRLWESSALAKHAYGRKGSCLDVTRLCLQDEICNRQMVPHIQACSGNPNHCNATHCQRAVQLFYDQMPYSVAVMLAFCDCSPTDDQCLQVKDVLHSRFCSEQQGTSPTCLEVLDRCLEETSCRHRYEVFHSKCWGGGRAVCRGHAGDGCESHMHEEMMRTDDNECRAAFIGTMGTFLQHPCTCNGLQNTEQLKCKQLNNVLHNRSHFVFHLTRESFPLYGGSLDNVSSKTGLSSLFSGTVAFVFVYIIVILLVIGVTMWVLHKKRICRPPERPRYLPSTNANDCLVIY